MLFALISSSSCSFLYCLFLEGNPPNEILPGMLVFFLEHVTQHHLNYFISNDASVGCIWKWAKVTHLLLQALHYPVAGNNDQNKITRIPALPLLWVTHFFTFLLACSMISSVFSSLRTRIFSPPILVEKISCPRWKSWIFVLCSTWVVVE